MSDDDVATGHEADRDGETTASGDHSPLPADDDERTLRAMVGQRGAVKPLAPARAAAMTSKKPTAVGLGPVKRPGDPITSASTPVRPIPRGDVETLDAAADTSASVVTSTGTIVPALSVPGAVQIREMMDDDVDTTEVR